MAISIKRYVSIVSGVGAAAAVAQRELIGRLFNDNPLIPINAILEFTSSDDVGAYFGFQSPEYLRAVFYFGFVSKLIGSPKKLSFARYAKATAPARIYGGVSSTTLATFQGVNAGTLNLTIGGQVANLVGINLAAAGSLAAVAAAIQAAIRAAAGTQYAAAVVAYDAVGKKFDLTASVNGAAALVQPTGTLAALLGWTAADCILSPGADVQTIDQALANAATISNNFGSFAFLTTLLTSEVIGAATWNDAQGVTYIGCFPAVDAATAETIYAAIANLQGAAITFAPTAGEFDEMAPMMLLAATDYERRAAVQNYMFQSFAVTPKVATDALADALDAVRTNYVGVTQTAGQQIAFYQRGVMTGDATAPTDQTVFANEIWFKDAAAVAVMTAFLALPQIPANAAGVGQLRTILQDPINRALLNGVISVGKPLTTAQKLYVTDATGDDKAWRQVQNIGYWIGIVILPFETQDGRTEWKAVYTLIYSKDDTIRKVEGSHVLI